MDRPNFATASEIVKHRNMVFEREKEAIEAAKNDLGGLLGTYNTVINRHRRFDDFVMRFQPSDQWTSPTPTAQLVKEIFYSVAPPYPEMDERPVDIKRGMLAVGAVVLPVSSVRKNEETKVAARLSDRLSFGNCADAEEKFVKMARQVEGDSRSNYNMPRIEVFHDAAGRELAIKKTEEAHSALTLVATDLDEVILPSGTIIRVGGNKPFTQTGEKSVENDKGEFKLRTWLVDEVIPVVPMRLSPWAYDNPLDRSLFSMKARGNKPDGARNSLINSATIDDFRATARIVLRECGVVDGSS